MTPLTMAVNPSPLEKWFKRLVHISLCILALPFLGAGVVVFNSSRNEAKAVERARTLPQRERQAILSNCVDLSRGLKGEDFELTFQAEPNATGQPIPPPFAALQPRRVRVYKKSVWITLYSMLDSSATVHCDGLDTLTPTATLKWGETENSEPWVSLEAPR